MTTNYNIYTGKDSFWIDESGVKIPYNRTTKAERLTERKASQIIRKAISLNKQLKEFKKLLKKASQEVYQAWLKENGGKEKTDYKGNFTWYNFDRSIKIEVNISEPIDFDDMTIQSAQEKFKEFLDNNINSDNEFVKQLVLDAFETRRGKLDSKRVLGLTKYVHKVNDPLFTEAVNLINKSIRRKKTKTYYKIWIRNADGGYDYIDLNLSSVKINDNDN